MKKVEMSLGALREIYRAMLCEPRGIKPWTFDQQRMRAQTTQALRELIETAEATVPDGGKA
jgi:hypothetical protein